MEAHILKNPKLHIVLDRPRIAGNIAAIIRLAAGTQCAVHVCGPLVFETTDKTKWRAGLDYFFGARIHFHQNIARCLALLKKTPWLIEVGGKKAPWQVELLEQDLIVLGPETASISDEVLQAYPDRILTLPQVGPVRSLNLAQCAAVVAFEASRQQMCRASTDATLVFAPRGGS